MDYNEYLTRAVQVPVYNPSNVTGAPVSNIQAGELLSDLKIDKTGKIIGVTSDWQSFDRTFATYIAADTVKISSQEIFNKLQIGFPVKIKQTTDKYFYVIGKDTSTNYIYINGGDDYTFTNAAIDEISFAESSNASGFPQVFDFSTSLEVWGYDTTPGTWTNITSNFEGGGGLREAEYSMNGSVVTVSYNIGTTSMPADIDNVVMTSPFIQRTQSQVNVGTPTYLTAGSTTPGSSIYISMIWGWINSSGGFAGDPFSPYTLGVVTAPSLALGESFNSGSFGMRNTFVVAV